MSALVLVGHGSLRSGAGRAMLRLASAARSDGLAATATAGFLNFSRPTLAEALGRCARQGERSAVVLPYFLIAGHYVEGALPPLVAEATAELPGLEVRIAGPLGHHPALVKLALDRSRAAVASDRIDGRSNSAPAALLLMAHGTPDPAANAPIHAVAEDLGATGRFAAVEVGFLELNTPGLFEAIDRLVAAGAERVVAVPYFLQLGAHVRSELPAVIDAARLRHPSVAILLARYLGFHPLLLQVIACRFRQAIT